MKPKYDGSLTEYRTVKNLVPLQFRSFVAWLAVEMVLAVSLTAALAQSEGSPKIHQVPGGPGEVFANAYIIEGRTGTVVIDALLTRSGSRNLRERVEAIGKPLLAVVLTHGHPDHYGGVAGLVEGRKEIPVAAIKGVDAIIRRDDAMKGERLKTFGIDWAETRTFPNVIVEGGARLTLGDIKLTPIDLEEGESHHDSIWILETSEGEQAFVGDLVIGAPRDRRHWAWDVRAQSTDRGAV
jgi:glyoxylase-like metal-dependent hydrolase (beta-lactamase superfamily II)